MDAPEVPPSWKLHYAQALAVFI